jgi:hypothetical protein
VDARIGEAEPGGALASALDRAVDLLKGIFGEDAIVAEALDFKHSAALVDKTADRSGKLDIAMGMT